MNDKEKIEILENLVKAKDDLLACYRLNRRPFEKLFSKLEELQNKLNPGAKT